MENARSLASRFSGLILFLMSLAVVGVLVYLTIESANDDSANNGDSAVQVESEASENSVSGGGEESANDDSSASSTSSEAGSTPNTGGDEGSDVAASTTTGEPLPNTGPESTVASAVALGGLVFAARAYLSSRRELAELNRR